MAGSRKNRPLRPFTWLLLLGAVAFAAGCSTANDTGGGGTSANHVLPSGGSVPGWTVPAGGSQHAISATQEYASGGTLVSCTDCHGSDLQGGISRTSCFGNPAGCHHGTITGAITGEWVDVAPAVQQHGVWAKRAIGDGSFFSCQICHGRDFSGGGALISCFDCHAQPHPSAPWRGAGYTHTNTDPSNAPVCAQCHQANPGTPGCFNSTLCHGAASGHPAGWTAAPGAPQPHGNDAKAAAGLATGFAYCQGCHGTGTTPPANFGGNPPAVSCYTCHVPTSNSPHASQWLLGDTYVHTSTDQSNVQVCAQCHVNGASSPIPPPSPPAPAGTPPGCFNSTLCHGASVHPAGWAQSSQHGPAAKAAPSASGGFSFCQICHGTGTNFAGGATGISCYTCHGADAPHPGPGNWAGGGTPTHQTTDTGNATVCAFCHANGANSPILPPSPPAPAGTPPGCFNSTLCHG